MVERRPDPMRLATLAITGASLAAATWFVFLIPVPRLLIHGYGYWPEIWTYRLRFLVYATPFVSGLVLWLWAEKRFKRGFQADAWTEAQLAPVRSFLSSRLWAWSGLALIVVCATALLLRRSSYAGSVIYMLILPSQTAQRLRTLITPTSNKRSGLADWGNFQPIRSEHWGQHKA